MEDAFPESYCGGFESSWLLGSTLSSTSSLLVSLRTAMAVSRIAAVNDRIPLGGRESLSSLSSLELLDSCWICLCIGGCSEAAVNERGPLDEKKESSLSSLSDAELLDSC
jgi:hypothetical protein